MVAKNDARLALALKAVYRTGDGYIAAIWLTNVAGVAFVTYHRGPEMVIKELDLTKYLTPPQGLLDGVALPDIVVKMFAVIQVMAAADAAHRLRTFSNDDVMAASVERLAPQVAATFGDKVGHICYGDVASHETTQYLLEEMHIRVRSGDIATHSRVDIDPKSVREDDPNLN